MMSLVGPRQPETAADRMHTLANTFRKLSKARLLPVLLSCVGIPWCGAQATGQGTPAHGGVLIAVNQGDRDISLVNPEQNEEFARIPLGATTGHEVATSANGRLAFIPIYGDSTPGKPGSNGHEVVVVDLIQRRVVHRIRFRHGVRPHCIVRNTRDGMLYVTTELDQSVTIINPKSFKIVGAISTGRPQSHMLTLSPNGQLAFTANISTGSVSVLDLVARKLLKVIPVAQTIQRITTSADGQWVFTADQNNARLAIVGLRSDLVEKWITLPSLGYGTASTQDRHWLLVALPAANEIAVVNLLTFAVEKVIPVPAGPHEILIAPGGAFAFIACTSANAVARLNLASWQITSVTKVGTISDGIGWARGSAGMQ